MGHRVFDLDFQQKGIFQPFFNEVIILVGCRAVNPSSSSMVSASIIKAISFIEAQDFCARCIKSVTWKCPVKTPFHAMPCQCDLTHLQGSHDSKSASDCSELLATLRAAMVTVFPRLETHSMPTSTSPSAGHLTATSTLRLKIFIRHSFVL